MEPRVKSRLWGVGGTARRTILYEQREHGGRAGQRHQCREGGRAGKALTQHHTRAAAGNGHDMDRLREGAE